MSSMITLRARLVAGGAALLFLLALVLAVTAGHDAAWQPEQPHSEHVPVLDMQLPVDWNHGTDALPPATR